MSELILITGGARSGKSSFGERLSHEYSNNPAYIATAVITDREMEERINMHKQQRFGFTTYEQFENIDKLFCDTSHDLYLLDCLTIGLTNLIFKLNQAPELLDFESSLVLEQQVLNEVSLWIKSACTNDKTLIIVSNEIGMGLVPEYPLSRFFRDLAGRANKLIAGLADCVYFMVSGIPLKIKG